MIEKLHYNHEEYDCWSALDELAEKINEIIDYLNSEPRVDHSISELVIENKAGDELFRAPIVDKNKLPIEELYDDISDDIMEDR